MSDGPPIERVYDEIASHFSSTREYPWPEVTSFLSGRRGDLGLDIGCGNGRHTAVLAEVVDRAVGLDVSRGLLQEATARASGEGVPASFIQGDATALPIPDDAVDVALYIATIHHLGTAEARIQSLNELARVLGSPGIGLVSTWSTAHDRFDETEGFDTTIDWTLPGGETVPRFYHIYDPAEFERDIEASDLQVVEFEVSSGNCYATVEPGV